MSLSSSSNGFSFLWTTNLSNSNSKTVTEVTESPESISQISFSFPLPPSLTHRHTHTPTSGGRRRGSYLRGRRRGNFFGNSYTLIISYHIPFFIFSLFVLLVPLLTPHPLPWLAAEKKRRRVVKYLCKKLDFKIEDILKGHFKKRDV